MTADPSAFDTARAVLEPAGTRVRDPISNKSVWLAGMLTDGRVEDNALKFNFEFTAHLSRDDRARMVEALTHNIREHGWPGEVVPNVLVEGGRPDKGLSPRGLGTNNRTDPVFLGLQKTRLLDPTD